MQHECVGAQMFHKKCEILDNVSKNPHKEAKVKDVKVTKFIY